MAHLFRTDPDRRAGHGCHDDGRKGPADPQTSTIEEVKYKPSWWKKRAFSGTCSISIHVHSGWKDNQGDVSQGDVMTTCFLVPWAHGLVVWPSIDDTLRRLRGHTITICFTIRGCTLMHPYCLPSWRGSMSS